MTDIVERLRKLSDKGAAHSVGELWNGCDEAADQIEGLRDELRNAYRERDEASQDWEQAMRRVSELEDRKGRACNLNRMLKSQNGALLSQREAVEHAAKLCGWDKESSPDGDALEFLMGRIAELEALTEKQRQLEAQLQGEINRLEAQRVPDGFMAWLDAFVTTSALAGIEDHEEAWTWPNPPSDAHFFDGYPRLTTGDLRALHEALAALNAAPAPSAPAEGSNWDAQAYASMRDEIEHWKRRAEESDEALERIRNDLGPTHMGEPVIAAPVDEREAFEAWASGNGFDLSEYWAADGNNFENAATRLAYEIWQAARAQLRAVPVESSLRDAAIAELVRRKMTSGNSVPVERCIITAAEIAAIAHHQTTGDTE